MRFWRKHTETYEETRRRMIQETEVALLYGLRFPDRMIRIPTIEVGRGEFHPAFAAQFWSHVLEIDDRRR